MPNAIAKASKHELKCAWDILAQAAAKQHQQAERQRGGGQRRAGKAAQLMASMADQLRVLVRVHVDGCLLLRFESRDGAMRGRQNQIEVCPVAATDSSYHSATPTLFHTLLVAFFLLSFTCSVCVFFAFFNAHWLWLHWLIVSPLVAVAAFGF